MIGHTEALNHTTAKYPINRVECKVFSAPRGNYSGNQPNIFQGKLPDRIFIGMVDSTAFNGSFKKNPFNFKPRYEWLIVSGISLYKFALKWYSHQTTAHKNCKENYGTPT